jgi:hypothetical protein
MLSVDHNPGIDDLLDRWTARGLITAEQADLIRKDESSEPNLVGIALTHVGRRRSLIAEALGYLGGLLIVGWRCRRSQLFLLFAAGWVVLPAAVGTDSSGFGRCFGWPPAPAWECRTNTAG